MLCCYCRSHSRHPPRQRAPTSCIRQSVRSVLAPKLQRTLTPTVPQRQKSSFSYLPTPKEDTWGQFSYVLARPGAFPWGRIFLFTTVAFAQQPDTLSLKPPKHIGPGLLPGRWPLDPLGSEYHIEISTRRFCGSRTPSAVGTRGFSLPCQLSSIAEAGTPSRTSAALTVSARRFESARLYCCVPARSV